MKKYFSKFKASGVSPQSVTIQFSMVSAIGAFIAIAVNALLAQTFNVPMMMAPFGATCVLAFGIPESPLAQPRNIIGGHLISTVVGLTCLSLLGNHWYTLAIGVAFALAAMQLTKTTHPPAGADPLVTILGAYHWDFVVKPVLLGSVVITVIALLFNNMSRSRTYPRYWW